MLPEVLKAHEDDPEVDLSVPVTDLMTARHLLIELARNAGRQAQLKATLASIEGEYRGRLAALAEREQLVRQSLLNYCQVNGPASFPDVGGCSVRRSKPKLRVVDADRAADYLMAFHADTPGAVEEVTHHLITAEGNHLLRGAFEGEGVIPDGCELTPAGETLTVRGLS